MDFRCAAMRAAPGEGGMVEGEGFEDGSGFHFCCYHFGSAK